MADITLISNRKEPGRIGSLVLDATLNDSHSYTNEITDYPIEEGANINDHIKKNPITITITGFITNSPITFLEDISQATIDEVAENKAKNLSAISSNRISGAFSELMRIVGDDSSTQNISITPNNPKIVEVVTGLRVYTDMVMSKLEINRTPSDGESLRFSATFKKVKKAKSKIALVPHLNAGSVGEGAGNAPRIKDQASEKIDTGSQSPKQLKSVAKRLSESDLPGKIVDKVESLMGLK